MIFVGIDIDTVKCDCGNREGLVLLSAGPEDPSEFAHFHFLCPSCRRYLIVDCDAVDTEKIEHGGNL